MTKYQWYLVWKLFALPSALYDDICILICDQLSPAATSSHILAVADEDGCVQLLNTKKYGPASVVKGNKILMSLSQGYSL